MNYIQHLSAFYSRLYTDQRFTPHHISLYMALFQLWNAARFEQSFPINRQEIMQLAKIGSVNTYLKCLKDLHKWGFLEYQPSKNICIGSRIRIISFDNTTDTPVRHLNKQNKTGLNITLKEVTDFFKKKDIDASEATRFFNYYEAKGWMMGTSMIQNWEAAAVNWIGNADKFKNYEKPGANSPSKSQSRNLSATTAKNYGEPL